jgi:transcription antitermination factor NusG
VASATSSATKQVSVAVHELDELALPPQYIEERWYAAQTCANHEKRVQEQLLQRAVTSYLPLYSSVRRWKDRRVKLDLPLFPGYVFVRLALRDRLQILQVPSVVRLVGFSGHPTPLPDQEIDALRQGLDHSLPMEPHPYLKTGQRVRVTAGPLAGLEGILLRRKKTSRIVISLDLIMRSAAIEIDVTDVMPLPSYRLCASGIDQTQRKDSPPDVDE